VFSASVVVLAFLGDNPKILARPAGLEPATPGLEVPREEATRGSTTLLPLISLTFGQAPDHPRLLRAATHCQSFVSRLSPFDEDDLFVREGVCCETQCRTNVLASETRIAVEEIYLGRTFAEFAEDQLNRNPRSTDDRFAEHHTRIDLDAIHDRHAIGRNTPETRSRDLDERFTSFKGDDDRTEIGFDAPKQFRPTCVADSNPHYLRSGVQKPVNGEVLILGDDDGFGACCVLADCAVGGGRKPTIGYVFSDVAECLNPSRERRRQLRVDEEAQSGAPQNRVVVLAGGEFQHCRDVFGFEVGIVGQDLFPRRTGREKVEDILHTNAESPKAGAATAHIRIHRDSLYGAHVLSPAGQPWLEPF
jgi:hypothetical protein